MKILLVEDDPSIAASLIDGLKSSAFEVFHVTTGALAIQESAATRHDLILLDLGLPDADGQDVCKAIRANSDVPIIVISARNEEIDRVLALEFGADDFMVKPFGMRELVARIRAVVRRSNPDESSNNTVAQYIGELRIDRRSQKVSLAGEEIYLTAKEFELLAYKLVWHYKDSRCPRRSFA